MNYLQFREQWLDVGCFSIYQLRAWKNDFDGNALSRWVKKGYIAKLRQDWYAFSELLQEPDMARFIAGKIYSPSYISLHSALSIYGIIPEAVTQIGRSSCWLALDSITHAVHRNHSSPCLA